MTAEAIGALVRDAILLSLLMSAPLVGAAALVGLLLGFVQALTQLQDQTTAYALKVLVVFGLLLLLMPWLGVQMFAYGERVFTTIFELK